jgi:hypothetical protein
VTPKEEAAIRRELDAINKSLQETLALSRLLLAMRLEQDGHAPNLGAALELGKDLDAVRALYPDLDD